ncbi:MAG: hypothetical protein N2663_00955 [Chlorobi bacterium]|nr:hypothetical protein [Chlorobiota bacterium]
MKSVPKLLVGLALCVSAFCYGQWSDPVRIAVLSTQSDEFAPAWSPADSTLYFARQLHDVLVVLACRHCSVDRLIATDTVPLDTIRDSILYASFNGVHWVGHRLVQGKRQRYTALVIAPLPRRDAGVAVPIAELELPERFAMYPTLSSDSKTLIFATTNDARQLPTDLWVSRWNGSQWSIPYPLDGFEQSPGYEITPCFVGNDTLLFASDGFGGRGSFDLYMTVRSAGQWQPPLPLISINSATDDRDPCILPNGDLLFVSNRSGNFDIYLARRQKNERP